MTKEIKKTETEETHKIIFSGIAAGLLEHYTGYIPRTVLDHYQTDKKNVRTTAKIARDIYRKNGLPGFFAGNIPMFTSISLSHAWFFYFYERHKACENGFQSIGYSALAKIGHDITLIPGDTIRMRTNLSGKPYTAVIREIHAELGYKGFVKSSPFVLAMNIPSGIIEFYTMKTCVHKFGDETYKIFGYGALAGVFSSVINNPLDVIKTHVQSQGTVNQYTREKVPIHKSLTSLVKNLYKDFGIRGFFKGGLLRSLQCSICYGSFELISKTLNIDLRDLRDLRDT